MTDWNGMALTHLHFRFAHPAPPAVAGGLGLALSFLVLRGVRAEPV